MSRTFQLLLCLHIVFLLGMVEGQARRAISTGGLPSFSREQEEILPDFVSKPFDETYFSWEMRQDVDGNDVLAGQFNYSGEIYVAIGIKSYKRMYGPIIVCFANASAGEAFCKDYVGIEGGYGLEQVADETYTTYAALSAKLNQIAFARVIRKKGQSESEALIDMTGTHRVIFAQGTWPDETELPKQHHTDSRTAQSIDFVAGKVEKIVSTYHRTALYVILGTALVLAFAVRLSYGFVSQINPALRNVMGVVFCIIYLLALGGYIFANYKDYKITVTGKAAVRCFGDGAALCFACLFIPIGKRLVFSDLMTVSHERAIKYHMFLAIVLVICVFVHAGGMLYFYDAAYLLRWRDKDEVSKLPGIFTLLMLLVMIVCALLRHQLSHALFRWTHALHPVLLFFAVCHYPKLALFISPGCGILILSFLYKRLVNPTEETETIESVTVYEDCGIIVLDIIKNDVVFPGQWYYLGFPDVSRTELHPFSVVRVKSSDDSRCLRFAIQKTKNVNGWTNKVFERLLSSKGNAPKSYLIDGPFGILQVRPKNYVHTLLIAGGIGMNPISHFLSAFAAGAGYAIGPISEKRSVGIIWVVRSRSVFNVFAPDIATYIKQIRNEFPHITVHVRMFITNSGNGKKDSAVEMSSSLDQNSKYDKMLNVTISQRPNWAQEVEMYAELCLKVNKAADGGGNSAPVLSLDEGGGALPIPSGGKSASSGGGAVEVSKLVHLTLTAAVYVAGPDALMKDASQAMASNTKELKFHVHTEEFQI